MPKKKTEKKEGLTCAKCKKDCTSAYVVGNGEHFCNDFCAGSKVA